jgi:hypothetical protein
MTAYLDGLEYDNELDILSHAQSSVIPGTYSYPALMQVDAMGHIMDIEPGSVGSNHITGLMMSYSTTTAVVVSAGTAFIPALNRIVQLDGDVTVSIPASSYGITYLYIEEVNGAGQIFTSTTAPDTPYYGTARAMPSDLTKRYIGMVKADGSALIIPFKDTGLGGSTVLRMYTTTLENTDLRVLSDYALTARGTKSLGPSNPTALERLVSPTSDLANLYVQSYATTGGPAAYVGYFVTGQTVPSHSVPASGSAAHYYPWVPLGANQSIWYQCGTTNNRLSVFVAGFYERR